MLGKTCQVNRHPAAAGGRERESDFSALLQGGFEESDVREDDDDDRAFSLTARGVPRR